LTALSEYGIRFFVVDGYAVVVYAESRYTKDLDPWLAAEAENVQGAHQALAMFGAPLHGARRATGPDEHPRSRGCGDSVPLIVDPHVARDAAVEACRQVVVGGQAHRAAVVDSAVDSGRNALACRVQAIVGRE
jgi:hypothetical protein